ncbi:hypothetical protein K432DRAFT_431075 [Lepidopterella palustris CBS 459.81]|uniref:Integral membrane protein n=1 Tax=Lepidopterella palustris CBS 459.81 TaxID=1314670 RepID=A0A8E2JKY9_9PEZI|nr:hypothetical protein K432DRAFT_431075 [Lepidopterella palustris CBS 459.81]
MEQSASLENDDDAPRPTPLTRRSQTYQHDGSIPHISLSSRRSKTFHQTFRPERIPLRYHSSLNLDSTRINGLFSFLNPTNAYFNPTSDLEKHAEAPSETSSEEGAQSTAHKLEPKDEQPASSISYKWTSRNNRKGRHALAVNMAPLLGQTRYLVPPSTASLRAIAHGIVRMFTYFPVWDVSYDVATIFTLGSVVWVINAFFVFYPLLHPSSEFNNEILYGGGITAFIGATIFEIGSVLLMAEAVNENRAGCFGWAVERVVADHSILEKGHAVSLRLRPSKSSCTHHHLNKHNLVGKGTSKASTTPSTPSQDKSWTWFPTLHDLRTHYVHELGFIASLSQLIGASIFWISGLTALPGIYNVLSPGLVDGIYWTPQVLGGSGFIISGTLFMLECQTKWWKPAFQTLGWHIGFWNLIGGIGFTLCPCFGYDSSSWAQYQAACSTFWGSWAFLIGSTVQWYESLDKHPVEVDKGLKPDGGLDEAEEGADEAEG